MPRVQAILKETINDQELHVHLNGDEAMSFGSSYIAANSTSSFKVRKVYLTQHPKYDIRIKIYPSDEEVASQKRELAAESADAEEQEDRIVYEKDTILYKRTDYLGQKKTIHLYYDVSMRIEALMVKEDGSEEPYTSWDINIAKLIEDKDVLRREKVTRPKVSLSFELSRSHLFLLNSAKVNVEETVLEEVVKEASKEDEKKEDEQKEEEGSEDKSDEDGDKAADDQADSKDE